MKAYLTQNEMNDYIVKLFQPCNDKHVDIFTSNKMTLAEVHGLVNAIIADLHFSSEA